MARAHFVKKARKDNPAAGIKVGDSYWWWEFRNGGVRYSKTQPKPSQLTQSAYKSAVLALQERMAVQSPNADELGPTRDDIVSELQTLLDECQSNYDNIPENLQSGASGEILQARIDSLESVISELEGIDCDIDEDSIKSELEGGEDAEEAFAEKLQEAVDEVWGEIINALDSVEL